MWPAETTHIGAIEGFAEFVRISVRAYIGEKTLWTQRQGRRREPENIAPPQEDTLWQGCNHGLMISIQLQSHGSGKKMNLSFNLMLHDVETTLSMLKQPCGRKTGGTQGDGVHEAATLPSWSHLVPDQVPEDDLSIGQGLHPLELGLCRGWHRQRQGGRAQGISLWYAPRDQKEVSGVSRGKKNGSTGSFEPGGDAFATRGSTEVPTRSTSCLWTAPHAF